MHTGPQLLEDVVPPRRGAPRRDQSEDLDVREYLAMLWEHRYVILGLGLLLGGLAVASSLTARPIYAGEVTLAVSRPKVTDSSNDSTAVANFIPMIANASIASQVIKQFALDKPPYNLLASSFFGSVVSVDEVRNSTVIELHGFLSDPDLLTRVLNRIAVLGVDATRTMSRQEVEQIRDEIKAQLDGSRQHMDEAEARLKQAREASQLELLRKDIDAQLMERSGLLKLQVDLESQRAQLAKAEQELAARNRVEVVHRTIDTDPGMSEAARATGASPRDLIGLGMRNEVLSGVYEDLDEEVAKRRAAIAGLERQRAELAAKKLDGPQLASLQRLYAAEAEISRLQMEQDLSQKVYEEVATSYEKARLTVAARSSALQILAPAVVPDRPLSRNVGRNAAFAFLAGAFVAGFVFVLRHAIAIPTRQ